MVPPMAELIILVAVARNGVIGRNGKLPWHLPSDLKHFKDTTMGHPLLMGRKTFDSIGMVLPGRESLVLTRNPEWTSPGCRIFRSLESALEHCRTYPKVYIIGGGEIFRKTMPFVDTILMTLLERDVEGDVFFPEIDLSRFKKVHSSHVTIEEPYSIIRYESTDNKVF